MSLFIQQWGFHRRVATTFNGFVNAKMANVPGDIDGAIAVSAAFAVNSARDSARNLRAFT
ncbi:hypothetical protein SAMN06265338_13312 [Rhodoblastus acidophilus]|uniref:Uncharacterized protein n=1 Tax=Rhodoblastus acidophilus TaxID=1074 RepID=A0A212SER6_RHOAC|nr:hypothetical protein SAMN06265338_13312 [Rhodoblastus acidophilus]